MIPESIGNYRILGPLGQGSTGVVYKAVRQGDNQPAALKLVAPGRFASAARREQFVREARAATQLTHPRLRRLYEVGETGDRLYLAMEYLEGSTLKNLLVSGPLATETAVAWAVEIAEGLAAAHEAGVVHGELIPAKVFITRDGSVKLLDAGLWRLAVPSGVDISQEDTVRAAQLPAGLVGGLAPEQIRSKEPDARSDVFGLGTLIYQMVTGCHPFAEGSPADSMYRVLERMPDPVSELSPEAPPALSSVLARALAKEPADRYPSAVKMAAALRAVAAGEELLVEEEKEEVVVEQAVEKATSPLWWAIGAATLLLVLWFLYLAFFRL